MKTPKSVYIAPHPVDVEILNTSMSDQLGVAGAFKGDDAVIQFRMGLGASKMLEVSLHEFLHGMVRYGPVPLQDEQEEPVVEAFGSALARWWVDNPDWVKVLEGLAEKVRKGRQGG